MSEEIDALHKPFIKFLRTEKLPYIRARSDRRSTIAAGAHDFTVFCGHQCLCIEFKTKGNDLDPDQVEWRDGMAAVGAKVFILRSVADAVELVQGWRSMVPQSGLAAAPEALERILGAWWRKTDKGLEKVRNA